MIDIPIAQSFTSSVMIQNKVINEGFAPEFAESHMLQTHTHDTVHTVNDEADVMHKLVVDRLNARSERDLQDRASDHSASFERLRSEADTRHNAAASQLRSQ